MSKLDQISRYLTKVYPSEKKFEEQLNKSKNLKIYLGIDPTSPNIHLGNAISLMILRYFQEWGHQVILLFGDFTGGIGDPSGHDQRRQPLVSKQLVENAQGYQEQVSKVLDFNNNPPQIVYNSQWWSKTDLKDFFEIINKFTLSQLIERDLFQERIKNKQPIAISEFLYPLLQGYDSVQLDTDIEIGGNDQTFNMMVGRQMLGRYKNREKFVLTTPLLEGTDGRKMSKSFGNTVDLSSEADQMYGKIMSIKDNLITKYMLLTTKIERKKIEKTESDLKSRSTNPMDKKKKLAFEIVRQYHGEDKAKKAQAEFERVFQKGGSPKAQKFYISDTNQSIIQLLVDSSLVSSRSEAKRLVDQGGVEMDGKKIRNLNDILSFGSGTIIRVGKLNSIELVLKEE